ncbi:helix-turn-helix transcriptional regulator, partial [Streptococcus suis]
VMNNNVQVGERIKQIRLSLGESMEKFGERFETSKGTVNNWEKGRNLPNKENLKKISELGQMTVNELLYG